MRRNTADEFHFNRNAEESVPKREYFSSEEFSTPPALIETAPEYDGDFTVEKTQKTKKTKRSRHDLLKKIIMIPVASAIAVTTITLSSFDVDPLGEDFLNNINIIDDFNEIIEGKNRFPRLPNLDPDFAGKYAWSEFGSEEFLIVDGNYLWAGTMFTEFEAEHRGEEFPVGNIPGASYDKKKNVLTLEDYHGGNIEANLMGNGFKINLVGDNSVDSVMIWGAMYGGSVTFTGSGSIVINKDMTSQTGIYLECENSPSCVMVDNKATVDVYGESAIIIHCTKLKKAIYTLEGTTITGGECAEGEFVKSFDYVYDENNNPIMDEDGNYITVEKTVKDIAKELNTTLYDYSVVDEEGIPSKHVLFEPET